MKFLIFVLLLIFAIPVSGSDSLSFSELNNTEEMISSSIDTIYINYQTPDEIEIIRSMSDKLVSTVYWSLGFAAVFLLALLGLIGYFTQHRYENDFSTLKVKLENDLNEKSSELDENIVRKTNEILETSKQMSKSLEESLTNLVSTEIKDVLPIIESMDHKLNIQISSNKYYIYQLQYEQAKEKEIWPLAYRIQFEIAEIGKEREWEWLISKSLEIIEGILRDHHKPSGDNRRQLTEFLNNLHDSYEPLVTSIKSLIAS